jgi:O-antigen/teichoic acid export membrane protein
VDQGANTPDGEAMTLLVRGLRTGSVGRVAALFAQAALSVVLARALGPQGLGAYAAVVAVSGFITLAVGLQLELQAARSADLAWCARALPWSLVAGAVGVVLGATVATLLNGAEAAALWAYLLLIGFSPAFGLVQGTLAAAGDTGRTVLLRTAVPVLRLAIVGTAFAAHFQLSPARIALLDGMIQTGALLIGLSLVRRRTHPWHLSDLRFLLSILRPVPALAAVAAAWLILQRTDLLTIAQVIGVKAAGRYQVALRLAETPLNLYAASLVMFLPAVSRVGRAGDIRPIYEMTVYAATTFLAPILISLGIWGDVIVRPLFGADFVGPRAVYAVIAVGLYVQAVSGPSGYVLVARRRHRELVLVAVITAIATVGLNVLLVPRWGLIGGATASTIGFVSMNAMYLWLIRRDLAGIIARSGCIQWFVSVTAMVSAVNLGGRLMFGPNLAAAAGCGLVSLIVILSLTYWFPRARQSLRALLRFQGQRGGVDVTLK